MKSYLKSPKTTLYAVFNTIGFIAGFIMLYRKSITIDEFTTFMVIINSFVTTLIGITSKDETDDKEDVDLPLDGPDNVQLLDKEEDCKKGE